MEMVNIIGLMAMCIEESIGMDWEMDLGLCIMKMDKVLREDGLRDKNMGKVSIGPSKGILLALGDVVNSLLNVDWLASFYESSSFVY